jgi:hypothetical protein
MKTLIPKVHCQYYGGTEDTRDFRRRGGTNRNLVTVAAKSLFCYVGDESQIHTSSDGEVHPG